MEIIRLPSEIMIKTDRLQLEIQKIEDRIYYSVSSEKMAIRQATSALLVKEKKIFTPFLPFIKKDHSLASGAKIAPFTDQIGSGTHLILKQFFTPQSPSKYAIPTIQIPCAWEFKIYETFLHPNLATMSHPFFSIQIFIEFIPQDCLPLALIGFAPLFMKDHGEIQFPSESGDTFDPQNITFFSNGWQSWSLNYLLGYTDKWPSCPVKMGRIIGENQDSIIPGRYQGEYHTVITDTSDDSSLVFGFITLKNQFSRVLMDRLRSHGRVSWLCAYSQTDGLSFQHLNDDLKRSEILMIALVDRPQAYEVLQSICRFGGIIEKSLSLKEEAPDKILTGWCSWYYYYTKVTESDMISNLEFFKRNPDVPVDLIQLDDGYQTWIGDWGQDGVINQKFPHGLDWLVNQIHKAGFLAGLWEAPFFTAKKAKLFQNHPEWALRDKNGKLINTLSNWGHKNFGLDLSRDDVIEYLRNLGQMVGPNWGFDFFKIDFLYSSVAADAIFKNPVYSRAQLLRRGVEAIRRGLGGQRILLGCGAPLGPCVGLVDVMRIGEDTKEEWFPLKIIQNLGHIGLPALKPALKATIQRSYMHEVWWKNDPDCVIVRDFDSKLTLEEIILQLTVFGLSGGQLMLSDDEPKVSKDRMKLFKKLLPPYSPQISEAYHGLPEKNDSAIPLDLFHNDLPQIFARTVQTVFGVRHLVSLLNWENSETLRNVPIKSLMSWEHRQAYSDDQQFFVFDFWNEKCLGHYSLVETMKEMTIPRHGCLYLSLIPFNPADTDTTPLLFLSSTLHIMQGALEIVESKSDGEKLALSLKLPGQREGNLYFWVVETASITSTTNALKTFPDTNGSILKVHVYLDQETRVELTYG